MTKNKKIRKENWFIKYWRPAVGWAFVVIILFDFILAPLITFAFIKAGLLASHWVPLTLDAAGTFYISMGIILGVTSYTRGQEKIEQIKKGYDFPEDDNGPKIDPGPPL
jgi:hypothetical protein